VSKILYLSYDGLTDPLGQSQVLPYIQHLSKLGFSFTILSFEKKERFNQEKRNVEEITMTYGIKWVPLRFSAKPPILSKIYDRYNMRRQAVRLHRKEKFNMVHCRSYVAAETGWYLKQKFGVKMLFDMRGFWVDERVDNGQWRKDHWLFKTLYNYYKKKERTFLLNADGIVSLTHAAKDYLLKKTEYKNLTIQVIPCCADLDHFDYKNVSVEAIRHQRGLLGIPETAKVVSYLGSVGGWYMTKEMFSFFKILQEKNFDFVFLILTKDDPEKVKEEARQANISLDKIHIQYVPRNQLPLYLALSNYSVFFIRNSFSKIASSPTKHAELMGMGVPVVCNSIGDTGHIIEKTKTGIVVPEFSQQALQLAADKLFHENFDKEYIRNCAKEIFDLSYGIKKYMEIYQRLLPR
jgi:glycosyltransferase involved in cell wall biosynthesis